MVGLERLLIGRTLDGRYTIEELIGQGRGGLVYRARHPHTGVEVALKVVAAPRTPEARERFRKLVAGEVKLAAAIEHPNVAGVYCLGHDAELDLDFVTSELLRGQTLASVLSQRGKPPIALGLRLLAEAAEGLAAGHRAGLVHRDLRPASLYLVRSDTERQVRVKVAGFGVPQIVRRESLAAAPPEIGAYASPELLAAGSLRLGPASDVFSLGVVGYELLTGQHPFGEQARRALAAGQTVEAAPPADVAASVPPQVVDAVLQALRCNPAERHADGAAFAAAMQQPVRQVMAVGKIAPAAQPGPAAVPVARPTPEPAAVASAEPAVAAVAPAAAGAAGVVDITDLAADEPAADPAVAEAAAPGGISSAGAVPARAAADLPDNTSAAADAETAVAAAAMQPEPAVAAPVESRAAAADALATVSAPAPAVAPPPPPRDLTRTPAPKTAAGGRPAAPDLDLYYPPQAPKPPVAAPAFSAAPPVAPQPAAPAPPPAIIETPAPVAAVPTPVAPPAAAAPPPPVRETPAPAPVTQAAAAAATATPIPAARRRTGAAAGGGFRGSAMAAGFVLGILVLGSAAWMATRHNRPAVSAAAPLASQFAPGSAVVPGAAPAQPADARRAPSTPAPATTADTANRTAEQRAADLRRKQQDDERRRQEQEKARQAELLQQQQLAQQQARPGTPPSAAQQPAPAQPQPQQVAAAQPQRPAPQPVAPPPAPTPAPVAAREEAEPAPSASTVFDEGVVEERPRLTNISELQRALQDRYPAQLYANRVSGRVTASFVVGADGRVDPGSIRIVSSPNPGFNTPTATVLRRARFRPARVKGQPVRVQVTMPIAWTLDQ